MDLFVREGSVPRGCPFRGTCFSKGEYKGLRVGVNRISGVITAFLPSYVLHHSPGEFTVKEQGHSTGPYHKTPSSRLEIYISSIGPINSHQPETIVPFSQAEGVHRFFLATYLYVMLYVYDDLISFHTEYTNSVS